MGLMDELKNTQPLELGGTGHTFIDADTLTKDKKNYRIQGIDAAEVEKIIGGKLKQGTAGGEETTNIIHGLANDQGYTNVVPLFNPDGSPKMDTLKKRQMIDLTNDAGISFKSSLIAAGAFDINKHTTDQDVALREITKARNEQAALDGTGAATAFDMAAIQIKEAELAEGAKIRGFKKTAIDQAERGQMIQGIMARDGVDFATAKALVNTEYTNTVQIEQLDRNINNQSLNPFSDSWDQGWTGVGESAFGIANMFGEITDNEGLAEWGQDGVDRQKAKLGQYGSTLLDYTEVDGIGDAFEYLGNNLALSIPYMAVTLGSGIAGAAAAPVIGVAAGAGAIGLGIPSLMYTGQTWNEMEAVEGGKGKSAAVAIGSGIAQATLDKLGLSAIFGKGIAPKKLMKKAVDALVAKGATRKAAEETVVAASRRQIAEFAGGASKIARQQIAAKAVSMDLLKRFGKGAVGEAGTEAAQEATAYLGATYGSDKAFDFQDLQKRMISAAIAGGTLGGGLSVPGAVTNTAAWADIAYRLDPSSSEHASKAEQYASEEKNRYGSVTSIEALAADAAVRGAANPGQTMLDRTDDHRAAQGAKSVTDQITEKLLNVPSFWQGSVRNILHPDLTDRSRSARVLKDMFGGGLQRVFSGSSYENSKHHRVSVYKNSIVDPPSFWADTVGNSEPKSSKKVEMSKDAYARLNAAVDANGNFDSSKVTGKNAQAVINLGNELNALSKKMWDDQVKHNPQLGKVDNYLFKYKALNKEAINKDKPAFIKALTDSGYSQKDALALTEQIMDNPEVADVNEAFSVVKGGIVPTSHRARNLGMSEKAEFQAFMEQDIFANVSAAAKSAARYTAHREYVGKNGAVVNRLLDDMQAEGVPKAEVDKVAAGLKDYLDAESGNYKRPQSALGKSAARVQKNFMFFTTLAGLPLATISSFVEMALVHKGLNKEQVFGGEKSGSLKTMGVELGSAVWKGMEEVAAAVPGVGDKARFSGMTDGQRELKKHGYYEWDVGAATTTGVTEVNETQKQYYQDFFKWTGLSGFTNYTRAARAALAGDYIQDKTSMISVHRKGGEPRTREIQEAEEALRNLGIDVDQYIALYDKIPTGIPRTAEEEAFMESTSREAMFNWVNDAVALPQAANRPLIYQDPRFALFTQFQGFIATFTANHIPKLWGEYVTRGTPAMKYNAFAVMATMIMLGFASQALKDFIKYGLDEDDDRVGQNPHLDAAEYMQRGVRASGLLGTGERILDQFFPIYEQKTDGVGDWVFKTGTGESPALSNIGRLGKSAGHLIEGDVGNAAKYGAKSAPVIGPFSSIADWIGETASGWNFKSGG